MSKTGRNNRKPEDRNLEGKECSYAMYMAPCGLLLLGSDGEALTHCDWSRQYDVNEIPDVLRADDVILHAAKLLDAYFDGDRSPLLIAMRQKGTPFQQRVWEALADIPYGETVSYTEFTAAMGLDKTSVRAVSAAIGANRLSIFLPCHRVVGADKSLRGYRGGLDAKRYLLQLEKKKPGQ